MKSLRHLFLKVTGKSHLPNEQLELSLPGSRITREEAAFLRRIRQLRGQLAAERS
jgi:hypothetical protein